MKNLNINKFIGLLNNLLLITINVFSGYNRLYMLKKKLERANFNKRMDDKIIEEKKAKMSTTTPTQMLVIYGGITGLVYVETDEFRKEAPFLFVMPVIALAALTLTLSMHTKQKYCTTASFLVVGNIVFRCNFIYSYF